MFLSATLMVYSQSEQDQQGKSILKGLVVDTKNIPLNNVSMYLEGTTYGVITDENGEFELSVPSGDYLLVATSIGYERQEQNVKLRAEKITQINLTLQKKVELLDEVVVQGGYLRDVLLKATSATKSDLKLINTPGPYSRSRETNVRGTRPYHHAAGFEKYLWSCPGRE